MVLQLAQLKHGGDVLVMISPPLVSGSSLGECEEFKSNSRFGTGRGLSFRGVSGLFNHVSVLIPVRFSQGHRAHVDISAGHPAAPSSTRQL